MTEMSVDVAIVGAGAAGIAAARRLSAAGRSVLMVEALPRLGGRAQTILTGGWPLDLGCGWLHSAERNPLATLAAAEGLEIDCSDAAWGRQLDGLGASEDVRAGAWNAYEAFARRLRRDPPASDRAGDAIGRDDPWRPFIDALSGFMNGVEIDRLSIRDFLSYDDAASQENWRLPGGYGAAIARLGVGLPASLGTRVTAVKERHGRVLVDTDGGALEAGAAIVTVSTERGAIRFDPAADGHLDAAACLPLGLADKVFLSLAEPEAVPPESHLLGRFDSTRTASYYLRPFGRPIVECFLGGVAAREIEAMGKAAAIAFVTEELGALLGSRFARGLAPLAVTAWGREAGILGSYSHALPGAADARTRLAAPVSPRLAFAGEACAPHDFSTAHGAWQSGLAAADLIEGVLP